MARLEPNGKRYRFRVYANGTRRWQDVPVEHCRTKTAATQWMNRYTGGAKTVAPSNLRFKQFAEEWIETSTQIKDTTKHGYRIILDSHLAPLWHVKVHELSADDARRMLELMEGLADGTKRNALNLLSVISETAIAREKLAINPVKQMEKREKPKSRGRSFKRILTEEEAEKLLDAAGPNAVMVACALFAGLRRAEITQLQWRHIRFDEGVIHLEEDHQMKLKGPEGCREKASNRDVGMSPRLIEMLRAHRRETPYRAPHHFVFPTASGLELSPRNFLRMLVDTQYDMKPPKNRHGSVIWQAEEDGTWTRISGWVVKAGIYDPNRPLTLHTLRHNYGSRAISAGADYVAVSVQMGHADPAITARVYSHEISKAHSASVVSGAIASVFG